MRGPKPKPTQLKLTLGNPGKRKLNHREPKPKQEIPPCPAFLNDAAKAEYERMSLVLSRNGILTELDGALLAAYSVAYSRWGFAEKHLQQYGEVILSPDKKFPVQSPYLAIANRAMDQTLRILAEFGMTPSSRSRIQTAGPEADDGKNYFFDAG